MHSEEEIYQRMRKALIDVFEIPGERISMDAHLADDLDIDRIDAVDLIAELRELLPRKVDPEEFTLKLASEPFPLRGYKRIAVKVVDVYGNESVVVRDLV